MNRLTSALFLVCIAVSLPAVPVGAEDHPDRTVQPVVPHGQVTSGQFADSQMFPGTVRAYSVYVPAQYKADDPAALMVFMDGKCDRHPYHFCVAAAFCVTKADGQT